MSEAQDKDANNEKIVDDSASNIMASSNVGADISGTNLQGNSSMTVGGTEKNTAQTAEQRKMGSFPGDLSNIKPIFGLKSKNTQAKERFSQKAQEYLDSHKMSIYLQDAIKIILDRREEKPLDLLTD
jgi:hypothetical protein